MKFKMGDKILTVNAEARAQKREAARVSEQELREAFVEWWEAVGAGDDLAKLGLLVTVLRKKEKALWTNEEPPQKWTRSDFALHLGIDLAGM